MVNFILKLFLPVSTVKKTIVKEWPSNKPVDHSWGRCGFESLYK